MGSEGSEMHLDDWVANGLISAEQAEEIRQFESGRSAAETDAAEPAARREAAPAGSPTAAAGRRVPLAAEVLGYVGGCLALAALLTWMGEFWGDLGTGSRLSLLGVVSVVCLGGGWRLSGLAAAQGMRLGYTLLFLGTGTFGVFVGLVIDAAVHGGKWPPILGTAGALVVGFSVWWTRRTWPQLVAVALALAGFIPAVASVWLSDSDANRTIIYFLFFVVGVLWCVAGELEWLRPRVTAWAIGSLLVLAAGQLLALHDQGQLSSGYLAFACIVSVALIGAGLWRGRVVPVGLGAAGLVSFTLQLRFKLFSGALDVRATLLIIGALLVAISAVVIATRARLRERSRA